MAEFNSPIGGRSFQGQGMREVEIPDETGYTESMKMPQPPRQVEMDEKSIRELQMRLAQQAQMNYDMQQSPSDADLEREIREARKAKITGKERLNDGAKRRIEMLLGMTRITREVEIEGNVFVLRTLKAKEMRDAIAVAAEFDGTIHGPYEIRRQLLARSLTQVAGVEIEQFIGSSLLEHKLLFLDELDESLISRLYDEYVILSQDSKSKYAIKSDEEAKGVVEDIKK